MNADADFVSETNEQAGSLLESALGSSPVEGNRKMQDEHRRNWAIIQTHPWLQLPSEGRVLCLSSGTESCSPLETRGLFFPPNYTNMLLAADWLTALENVQ